MRTFFTHDNGDRPFKVTIDEQNVKVYGKTENDVYSENPELNLISEETFIGKSPENAMTLFSGGYGDEFDGNSILIKTGQNEYFFIGRMTVKFSSIDQITRFTSPVGNNDVPYPYAVDTLNNYYLMISDIILLTPSLSQTQDPYDYYFTNSLITRESFQNIKKFFINGEEYNMTASEDPAKDYDRFMNEEEFGGNVMIEYVDGEMRQITKDEYVEINTNFFLFKNFRKMTPS